MPVYQYSATTSDGRTERGLLHGDSLATVAGELERKGLVVREIGPAASVGDPLSGPAPQAAPPPQEVPSQGPSVDPRNPVLTQVVGPLVGTVKLEHLHFFFRQLATMLDAGVNPVQSLDTLGNQSRSGKLKSIILETREHVLAGRPMTAGFQRYPEVFSPMVVAMVRAGEEGGFLVDALRHVADFLERDIKLRNLIKKETFYPKAVIAASIIIIVAANLLITMLAPGATGLSSPLTNPATWVFLGPFLVLVFLYFRVGLAQPPIRHFHDTVMASLPWIGDMTKGFAMARFGRAFGALYRSGVPIHKGFRLAADVCGNEYLRGRMYPAASRMEAGAQITETLRATGAFSPIVLDMTQTGETTGSLDQMLTKMAEFYEGEGAVKAKQSGVILGVVAFLAVAIYIGYVVITFYTGYFGGIMDQVGAE